MKNLKTILDHEKPRLSLVQNMVHIDNRYLDNSLTIPVQYYSMKIPRSQTVPKQLVYCDHIKL